MPDVATALYVIGLVAPPAAVIVGALLLLVPRSVPQVHAAPDHAHAH